MPIRLPQSPEIKTALLALALAVAACGGEDSPLSPESADSPAPTPASVGPASATPELASLSLPGILFQSTRSGGGDIYRMAPDGTGAARVTSFSGAEYYPVWSWDHQRIAMVRNRLDGANVSHLDTYIMNADGSGKRWVRSAPSSYDIFSPSWSKDGTRLVVTVTFGGEDRLALMNVATGSTTFVSTAMAGPIGTGGHFDPSGQRLVYAGKYGDTLHLINADGTGHKILFAKNNVANPNFSPDGKKIAFGYSAPGEAAQIYVKTLADGTLKRVTTGGGFVPTWSPDGSKIAFVSSRTGKNQIFVVPSGGGTETRITNNSFVEYAPSWAH